MNDVSVERKIEQALMERFPGLRIRFILYANFSWEYVALDGCRKDFYDMYPTLNKRQADKRILQDITDIVEDHILPLLEIE